MIESITQPIQNVLVQIVNGINGFFTSIAPANEVWLVALLAGALAYWLKESLEVDFWYWPLLFVLIFGTFRWIGLGM